MILQYKNTFKEQYEKLPVPVQKRVDEKLKLLLLDPHHPSLQIKKVRGSEGISEGRISKGYRFTFQIKADSYILRKIGKHEILRKP